MNKLKRKIIQLRTRLVLSIVSEIKPIDGKSKWLNAWYVKHAKTPIQVANEIKQMKRSKVFAISHILNLNGEYYRIYGNFFSGKFPIVAHFCKIDEQSARNSYKRFLHGYSDYIAIKAPKLFMSISTSIETN